MATYNDEQTILSIKVNYDDAVEGIIRYREQVEKLKQAQKELAEEQEAEGTTEARREEITRAMVINNERIKEYQYNIRALSKEVQNTTRVEKAEMEGRQDSLNALRASLSNLTREYDELGKAEREGAKGKELQEHINAITTELKEAEAGTQRFYRNVGNYENAIQNMLGANSKWFQQLTAIRDITAGGLKQGLTMATTAVTSFGRSLLGLLANPIVAIFAAIAGAVMAVSKAIKSSEDNTNAWNMILAPFQRILTGVLSVIQDIVTAILSWVQNGARLVGWIMTMLEKLPLIGNWLKVINDQLRESITIAQTDAELAKERRQMEVQNAKDQAEIARLRKDAADAAQKDRKRQLDDLKRAEALERGIMERRVKYAEKDLANAKAKAAQSQNDAATNDELAQKEAAVYQARQSFYQGTMRMASGMATAEKALANQYTATGDAATNQAQKIEEAKRKERDAVRAAEDALAKLIKDNTERQRVEINLSYTRRIKDLKKRLSEEKDLTKTARAAILTEIKAQEQLMQQELNKISEENVQKRIEQESNRIGLLLQAVNDDYLKRRELQLAQLDAEQKLEEAKITQEIQNEQMREDTLMALRIAYNAKRLAVEQEFDKAIQDEQTKRIQQEFQTQIDAAGDNELEALRLQMEERLALLNAMQQREGESIEAFNQRKLEAERAYQQAKKAYAEKEVALENAKVKAIGSAVGALSDLMEEAGEKNKSMAMAAKVLALAEIAINQGVAIAQGIKQAQSVPYPANIAAIASTIATILTGITQAIKTVKSAKFATGGYVEGVGTGTSDSIPARLSNGESVMTAGATTLFSPLLSALNQLGGGIPIIATNPQQQMGEDMLAAAVAKGMAMAPRPVVSVQDINDGQHRVEVIDNIASV